MSKATQTDAMGSIQRGIKRTLDFVMSALVRNCNFSMSAFIL